RAPLHIQAHGTVLEFLFVLDSAGHDSFSGEERVSTRPSTVHITTRSGHTHTTTPDENWAITYPTANDQPHTTNPRTTTAAASTDGDDDEPSDEAPPF
ncbi:hypothetical protein, partial [Arthrobacter sp. CAU 1506]|uniref:hypothetical protein n=1 Tax=Arthrobacter sp. CAU 1506 TaxID=2560052 RepID=UPI00145DEB1C